MEDFKGNKHSHASPFARILEEGLEDLITVGVNLDTIQTSRMSNFQV